MRAVFAPEVLEDADAREAQGIVRRCVHCGFCTATCPTYLLLGDERDSPRGRIYLMKRMLESGEAADAETVRHVDRCLSCLSCMTTCPSGVDYMHLVDHARLHIERTYRRSLPDRLVRGLLLQILPYPWRFRLAALAGSFVRPFGQLFPGRMGALLSIAPPRVYPPSPGEIPRVFPADGERRVRVALLAGCVQNALAPDIHAASIRLLNRLGAEVVVAPGAGCCGALAHHLGVQDRAHRQAAANVRAWTGEITGEGLDAVVINASGCGTTVKDYGHMLRDTELAAEAAHVSEIARDISELVAELGGVAAQPPEPLHVAYHPACSLQHGQGVRAVPKQLLEAAGFRVSEPREAHICCGSAGTYNLLQPEIATRLKARKAAHVTALDADVLATGNIGCMMQLGDALAIPVVHIVELLDWATGGPKPPALGGEHPD